ncbi:MAG: hypothetical protein AB8B58_17980 [Roseobacter sp.]
MLTFSDRQFDTFRDGARRTWVAAEAPRLHATFAQHYTAHGTTPDTLVPVIQAVAAWAQSYGIRAQADVTRLSIIAASLGHRFWEDPRTAPMLATVLADTLPRSRSALTLTAEVKHWLGALWQGDDLAGFAARLGTAIRAGDPLETDTLRMILPGHWHILSAFDNDRLQQWLVACLPPDIARREGHALATVACALVHGTNWLADPQYPRLSALVRADSTPGALADGLNALYAEVCA